MAKQDDLPDHLFRWLDAANRRTGAALRERVAADPGLAAITGSRMRLLQLIPPNGATVTELADLAGGTKQGIGQQVSALEDLALVATGSDPADGRRRVVRRTDEGDRVSTEFDGHMRRVERAFAREVGATDYRAFRRVLRALGEGEFGTSPTR